MTQLDHKHWLENLGLAELFGYALACESERGVYLSQHRKFLSRKTVGIDYVKMVYNTQKGYPLFVDENIFKIVADLTPKLVGHGKSWCLKILASYVEHSTDTSSCITDMLDTIDICSLLQDNCVQALAIVKHASRGMGDRLRRRIVAVIATQCSNTDSKIRKAALEVALKIFQDLFKPKYSEPPYKKRKVDNNASPSLILKGGESPDIDRVVECVAMGVTDYDNDIATILRDGVAMCLDTSDMSVRLAECFLIAISIPATQRNQDVCICVSAFLEMLFKHLRSQVRFQALKLSEEPLPIRDSLTGSSKLLTNSRTYHGTFLSVASRKPKQIKEPVSKGINVEISIDEILVTLLQFAKEKIDVAQALCLQVIKTIVAHPSPGFDARAHTARLVGEVLNSPPSNLTPIAVQVARILVDTASVTFGFQNSLEKLRHNTKGTEGEALITLLWEDVMLRTGDFDMFYLGSGKHEDIYMDVEPEQPSLDELMSAFGKLSNWDKLTIQAKDEIKNSVLPHLWVDGSTFKCWLDAYEVPNTKSWFNKLVVTYRDESKRDGLRWLREMDRWPRNHFHVSAVAECIQRSSECTEAIMLPGVIKPADCLAEWAARIMIRRAFASSENDSSEELSVAQDEELVWCRMANDRQLPKLALNCIEVNASTLETNKLLPWLIEKSKALRTIGLDTQNTDKLKESLSLLESTSIKVDDTDLDVIILNKLILSLHQDLNSISKEIVLNRLETTDSHTEMQNVSNRNKRALFALYEIAMTYFDGIWSQDELKCELISNMADVLGRVIDLDLGLKSRMFLSVILNRLDVVEDLDENTSRKILEKISLLVENLDEFSLEAIKDNMKLFSPEVVAEFSNIINAVNRSEVEERHRRCLQLVCDPRYSLSLRCAKLLHTEDSSEWKAVFKLMKENIFENPYAVASTEYSLLNKYKYDLYQIENFEETDRSQRNAILNKILKDLSDKVTDRKTLRLSQLCPSLARRDEVGSESDRCMSRLLRLGKLSVVKFYEQVSVFTNAITRPVVMKVLLKDGTTRQYITKSGERLKMDAAAQAAARTAADICGAHFQGYTVTPLGEDSGLIEFLEDNTTFRELITSVHDLDETTRRLSKFIVSSSPMEKFKTYCNQIPANALRSAIENNCSSLEDFIKKKQHFLETYSSLTLFGSIFGLGDRHLENLLYINSSGASCCVDWANALQYGRGELPPARITRNVLGMVDGQALEARLQTLLSALRNSSKLYSNVVKLAFRWMGEEFLDKFTYITLFLRGEATTFDITEMSLTTSEESNKYKDQLSVLREIFNGETREAYSIVEQINCLLKQCTHARILSVTREGWESHI